jgi:hypothetical protein
LTICSSVNLAFLITPRLPQGPSSQRISWSENRLAGQPHDRFPLLSPAKHGGLPPIEYSCLTIPQLTDYLTCISPSPTSREARVAIKTAHHRYSCARHGRRPLRQFNTQLRASGLNSIAIYFRATTSRLLKKTAIPEYTYESWLCSCLKVMSPANHSSLAFRT